MRKNRRLLALLLTLAMILTFMPTMAFATTNNVAKIGDVEYQSLRAAVEAAVDGDTITMIADDKVSLTSTDPYLIINKNITIDGNGKVFYGMNTWDDEGTFHLIAIGGGKNVTIENIHLTEFGGEGYVRQRGRICPIQVNNKNGTLTLKNVDIDQFNHTAIVAFDGTVILEKCTITGNPKPRKDNPTDYFQCGIAVYGTTNVTCKDTTISKMGAVDEAYGWNEAGCVELVEDGSVTMESGSCSGDYCLIVQAGSSTGILEVKGGSYTGQTSIIDNETDDKERVSVSGGTFNQRIPSNVTIATDKAEVKNTDGTFTVTNESDVAATIGDTNYTSVDAAINDAQTGDTVDMKPAAAGTTVTTDKDINIKNDTGSTINLNGTNVASGETKNAKVAKAEADAAADLATAKKNAIDALNKTNLKSYAEPEKSKVKAAIDSAKKKIDAATTIAAVNSAKAAADKTIKAQPKYNSKLPKITARYASGYKGYLRARWYKLSKKNRNKISGIEVQYATDKNFKNYKIVRAHKTNSVKTVNKVARKKKFWVRARVYTVNKNGVKTVGTWSKIKTLKTK